MISRSYFKNVILVPIFAFAIFFVIKRLIAWAKPAVKQKKKQTCPLEKKLSCYHAYHSVFRAHEFDSAHVKSDIDKIKCRTFKFEATQIVI